VDVLAREIGGGWQQPAAPHAPQATPHGPWHRGPAGRPSGPWG
jgi:hypothetical protein